MTITHVHIHQTPQVQCLKTSTHRCNSHPTQMCSGEGQWMGGCERCTCCACISLARSCAETVWTAGSSAAIEYTLWRGGGEGCRIYDRTDIVIPWDNTATNKISMWVFTSTHHIHVYCTYIHHTSRHTVPSTCISMFKEGTAWNVYTCKGGLY